MDTRIGTIWVTSYIICALAIQSSARIGPYRVQSFNLPGHKLGVASITDGSPASLMTNGRRFLIHQPGLGQQNQTVSFEASDWPGHFLRHRGGLLYIDLKDDVTSGFKDAATFKFHQDLMHSGYFTLESVDQPGFYIRHEHSILSIKQSDNSTLFKADSSFRFLEGPYLIESEDLKNSVISADLSKIGRYTVAYMREQSHEGLKLNLIHPGLTNGAGTVSFESEEKPGFYLRHLRLQFPFTIWIENWNIETRAFKSFKQDATFKLCTYGCFIDGYVTLESVNFPTTYLSHTKTRVAILKASRRAASFRFINEPSFIGSFDHPRYRLETSPGSAGVLFTTRGTEFILVYPGLVGYPGTVSLEAAGNQRGRYLRTTANQNVAFSAGTRNSKFLHRASFYLRESPWYADTMAFESVATPQSYLIRNNLDLQLRVFENVEAFKLAASFIRPAINITEVTPTIGPKSGGTEVTFRGYNLNQENGTVHVLMENVECPVNFKNDTHIVCETPRVDQNIVGLPRNLTVKFDKTGSIFDVKQTFTYKEDPTITKVEPIETIIGGGVLLTVSGTGLDAVGRPKLEITVLYKGTSRYRAQTDCMAVNATQMYCPTPPLEILNEDGSVTSTALKSRRKRMSNRDDVNLQRAVQSDLDFSVHRSRRQADGVGFKINNGTVEIEIGFILDGVEGYRNLTESLPQYSKLNIYKNPKVRTWKDMKVVTFGKKFLEVQGEGLITGIQASDYEMLIGDSSCVTLIVYSNRIICTAPDSTPDPHPEDSSSGEIGVRIRIGLYLDPFLVGRVTYKISFFDNPIAKWGIIGGCVVVVLVVVMVIAVKIKKSRKSTK